ncbi:hypothetical protein, partial [Pelagicoccus sp. SDUM812002]|uniref:hypothetical protein n=1 Tax=Pelagicoccus sp. SDUM812002 TaxID=3041266 RepID=UPI00280D286A
VRRKIMTDQHDQWKSREPWVVQDPDHKREWVMEQPLRYYIHQNKEKEWRVIDRWYDLAHGDTHKTRGAAIRAFYKSMDRKIPTGTKLPELPDSKYSG